METSLILLWGSVALVVVIVLELLFSKRNVSKKEKMEPPIEVPEKEYSVYSGDEKDEPEDDDDDCEYSSGRGFGLSSMVTGIVILGTTITLIAAMFSGLSKTMEPMSYNSTTHNMAAYSIEDFSIFGPWFPLIFLVGMGAMILSIIIRVFEGVREWYKKSG